MAQPSKKHCMIDSPVRDRFGFKRRGQTGLTHRSILNLQVCGWHWDNVTTHTRRYWPLPLVCMNSLLVWGNSSQRPWSMPIHANAEILHCVNILLEILNISMKQVYPREPCTEEPNRSKTMACSNCCRNFNKVLQKEACVPPLLPSSLGHSSCCAQNFRVTN